MNAPDPDTAIGGPNARFPSTRLSLPEAAAVGLPNEALEDVGALLVASAAIIGRASG